MYCGEHRKYLYEIVPIAALISSASEVLGLGAFRLQTVELDCDALGWDKSYGESSAG